jgi:DNA-binding Lrp family transcriptional regulator
MTTAIETKPLSEKAKDVMDAILLDKTATAPKIAEYLGVSVATVTGSLATLKKRGYVVIEDGILVPTAEANFEFGTNTPSTVKPVDTEEVVTAVTDTNVAAGIVEEISAEIVSTAVAEIEIQNELQAELAEAVTGAPAVITTKATDIVDTKVEVAAATGTETIVETAGPTKAERARAVFNANKGAERKILMGLLTDPAVGLSKNGANTYIYNMRKAAGMVTPRSATPASTETPAGETVAETTTANDAEVIEVAAEGVSVPADEGTGLAATSEAPAEETPAEETPAA